MAFKAPASLDLPGCGDPKSLHCSSAAFHLRHFVLLTNRREAEGERRESYSCLKPRGSRLVILALRA